MGFSASGALVVLFIGLLVSASYLYPVLETSAERTHDATDAAELRLLRVQNTDFTLDAVNYYADDPAYGQNKLMIRVTNSGTTTLDVSTVDTLVDGAYGEMVAFEANSSASLVVDTLDAGQPHDEQVLWVPGETIEFWGTSPRPERVTVVVETGMARASPVTEGV